MKIEFLGMLLMLGGSVAGWKRDGLAGILRLAGYALFPIVELSLHGTFSLLRGRFSPFDFALFAGILLGFCWWYERTLGQKVIRNQ